MMLAALSPAADLPAIASRDETAKARLEIHRKPFIKQPFIKQIALLNRSPMVPYHFIQLVYSMVYQTGSVIKQITSGPNACLISSLQCIILAFSYNAVV